MDKALGNTDAEEVIRCAFNTIVGGQLAENARYSWVVGSAAYESKSHDGPLGQLIILVVGHFGQNVLEGDFGVGKAQGSYS